MAKIAWKGIVQVFKDSFKGFSDHKLTKLSGSLAYSTIFSLGPLLIVIISLCSIFFSREAVEGKIYGQLASFIGSQTAMQLQQIIKSGALTGKSHIAIIVGIITLLLGSTAVFGEIQDSINTIWGLKPKPKKNWLKILQNRFLSFSIIVSLGFLLLVSLAISSFIDGFSDYLKLHFKQITVITLYLINNVLTLVISTIIFAVIFKVLPDGKIKWKDIFVGSLITALFFMLGKFGISFYISKSNISTTYGAAGSIIILLLWIYYSSLILYFGAEITSSYAIRYGSKIYPKHYAVSTKTIEVNTDAIEVQKENV